ncbi:hypothetical protein QZH41_014843, partial [Actinostola sp. cb2023]
GTLHDKISLQTDLFPEEIVIWYFYQTCCAIEHIHDNDIVHRDIKTMNIFLTKSGLVKLGDFGISKILDSEGMADSIVGTPYYMSPELVQGKNECHYNATVGILINMVVVMMNPLRLVAEIVKGQYDEIDSRYTEDMNDMVNILLSLRNGQKSVAIECINKESKIPQKIDTFVRGNSALQVSAGHSHFAVLTVEKELFTWANAHGGKQMSGQLGHGDVASYRLPKKVDTFNDVPIRQVACGDDITACITDDNVLYTFGSDYYGCIGCKNEYGDEVLLPYKVPFFADKPVQQVSCGDSHIVALTGKIDNNEIYSWGCGEHGRLGLGSEDDVASPQKQGGHMSNANVPTVVQSLSRYTVSSIAPGKTHSAIIDENMVYAWGRGDNGRLGLAPDNLFKTRTSIPCSAVPHPVFGTLHSVTSIDCRYWNAIIVAEKVLNSRTIRSASRSLDSQSSTEDYVFSDRLRIEVDSIDDDDAAMIDRPLHNPMVDTADSGVGPSPRSPIPRTLGDTSLPPPWLQDEMIEAEYIPMDDSSIKKRSSSIEKDTPAMTSVGIQCNVEIPDTIEALSQNGLLQRILQLESENKQLRTTIQEQVVQIKSVQHENLVLTDKHTKLWELIDAWHKDCQTASAALKSSRQAPRKMPATPSLSDPSTPTPCSTSNDDITERVSQDSNAVDNLPKCHVSGSTGESREV